MVFNVADFTIDGEEYSPEELRAKLKLYIPIIQTPEFKPAKPKPKFKTASPTINTRAAMNDIFEMFNAPLSCDIVEKQVIEDETISAKVFKPLATFGKLGVFRDEPGVFRDEGKSEAGKLAVFRDEEAPKPRKMDVFRDEAAPKPRKMDVFRDEAASKPRKMQVFQDEPKKVQVFQDEAAPRKMEVFRDEPKKMQVSQDEEVPKSRKIQVFQNEPMKIDVFRDEVSIVKPERLEVFRDEPEKINVFQDEKTPAKMAVFRDENASKPLPEFDAKDSVDEVESPSKVDASLQSPREFIRAARSRKSNFRFEIFRDEEEEEEEEDSVDQPEGDSLNKRSQTKEALKELLGLDPTQKREDFQMLDAIDETPRKQVQQSPHREDIHSSYMHSSFMSNETDASLLDFKRALASSQDQEYNMGKGDRIFSSQVCFYLSSFAL
jgi:hypothetical protein